MKIIVTPLFGSKILNGSIKSCRSCNEDTQHSRIEGVDVIEMNDVSLASQ